MPRHAVSIQDIALEAGVSHATVSRALHDSPLISREVRLRIQDLAEEMGYTPNAVAQSLKGRRTNTIGLLVTSIADPFVGRVVRGIEDVAQEANVSVFLSASYNDPERAMSIIETFHRRRVDGVISASAQVSARFTQRLAAINMPTVLINHQAEVGTESLHTAEVDDYAGARQAVEHLLGLGHHAIGYLGVGNRPISNQRRLNGYLDALRAAGITPDPAWTCQGDPGHRQHSDDVADGRLLLPELLRGGVTGVFCYNDMTAIGALLACRDHTIAVPWQLSLIGFDDIEMAQYVTPPLTTIHQPKLRLGQVAMAMLLDILDERPAENQRVATDLVVRASTAPAPAQPAWPRQP
jgi:LacI family transcriptional regulator/LacI family repressor for deo operon, udp, cdd, tsx, nupC, and nupG